MYWKGLAGGMPSTRASVRGRCEFYDPQQRQGYLSVAGWAPDVHVLFRAEDVLGPPPAAGSAVLCELEQPRPGLEWRDLHLHIFSTRRWLPRKVVKGEGD